MARRRRIQFPGAVYHVMSRGNRKSMIVDDDDDRRRFMDRLSEAAEKYEVRVYAGCLMGTHYHILLDTPRGNLSEFVCELNSGYSKSFNRRHQRVGHTFEQRFESVVVQREKFLRRAARYIVLNPVEAGLCPDAADWRWSTYRATAGLEDAPSWLHLDWLRWAFRAESLADGQRRYQEYVRDRTGLSWSYDLRTTLGTPRFVKAVGRFLEASGRDDWIPLDCRYRAQPSLEKIFSTEELSIRSRDALILAAHVTHGYRQADIARFLSVERSTVSKAVRRARRAGELAGLVLNPRG
jgi:putative transposase